MQPPDLCTVFQTQLKKKKTKLSKQLKTKRFHLKKGLRFPLETWEKPLEVWSRVAIPLWWCLDGDGQWLLLRGAEALRGA